MIVSKQARIVTAAASARIETRRSPWRVTSAALVVGLVLAAPVVGALSWGVDAGQGVGDVKTAGASPQLGQTWVGTWMRTQGWSGFENDLRSMSAAGVTPVVLWYYWGDAISPSCVQYGCDGMSQAEWNSMAQTMASRANAIMGGKTFYVVLEPEFNKNGIESWETFDGLLASQASMIRSLAPSAKLVVGFGNWGGWDIFDRAVGASDMVGFQLLYASTRTSSATAVASADTMLSIGGTLHARFGKPMMVFDFDVASYGGWESVQQQAIANVVAKAPQLQAVGIQSVVWRYVRDNTYSSGYFGAAESTWGVEYANGVHKPAWQTLVDAIRGGSVTTAPSSATAAAANPFSGVSGNEWWIQANVAGDPTSVTATVSGATVALAWQSWGAWAASTHAPSGTLVTLTARYADGSTRSATYQWTSATLVTSPSPSGGATFSGVTGNSWWVQANVGGPQTIASVAARVNGGAWVPLAKQWWGGWAASFYVAPGSSVQLQATSTTGSVTLSGSYAW
jgi:hypothetical protein